MLCSLTDLQSVLDGSDIHESLSVFTKRPEAVFGISHILLSKDNSLNKEVFYDVSGYVMKQQLNLSI